MRLIDADKLKQHYAWWNDENKELFDTIVDAQPTVEMQKNKCGKWAHIGCDEWSCSCCGFIKHTEGSWKNPDAKYCENCGAKMELGGNKDES